MSINRLVLTVEEHEEGFQVEFDLDPPISEATMNGEEPPNSVQIIASVLALTLQGLMSEDEEVVVD